MIILDLLFGCLHGNYSFPRTVRKGAVRPMAAELTGTYVTCLECGRELPYDWSRMKVITAPQAAALVAAPGALRP